MRGTSFRCHFHTYIGDVRKTSYEDTCRQKCVGALANVATSNQQPTKNYILGIKIIISPHLTMQDE
jgi:hypothetical protein